MLSAEAWLENATPARRAVAEASQPIPRIRRVSDRRTPGSTGPGREATFLLPHASREQKGAGCGRALARRSPQAGCGLTRAIGYEALWSTMIASACARR